MRKIDVFISWVAEFILPLSLVDRVYIFGSALKDANAANDLDTIIVFNEILVRDTCVRLGAAFPNYSAFHCIFRFSIYPKNKN